jgi:F-type H+-transporting ATPase subunit delta
MKISKQSRRDAKTLFNVCRVDGLLDENRVRQAVTEVIAKKPRGYVGTLHQFKRLVKLDLDRRSARVENAVETTPAQVAAIKANLAKQYGPGLDVTFWVNPALIGGLRVKVGSDVYDGSVAGRLAALSASN